jgi:transposase
MAEAAQAAVGEPGQGLHVVADGGFSNGEQAEACEAQGIIVHAPAQRGVNNRGDGTLFSRTDFQYDQSSDTFLCPAGQRLHRYQRKPQFTVYAGKPEVCGACLLKSRCTVGAQRTLQKHLHDAALERMQQRATPDAMRLRKSIAEHPFAGLKYLFGIPRFLLRGLQGAQTEAGLAVMAYNLKRMINVVGGQVLAAKLVAV